MKLGIEVGARHHVAVLEVDLLLPAPGISVSSFLLSAWERWTSWEYKLEQISFNGWSSMLSKQQCPIGHKQHLRGFEGSLLSQR